MSIFGSACLSTSPCFTKPFSVAENLLVREDSNRAGFAPEVGLAREPLSDFSSCRRLS